MGTTVVEYRRASINDVHRLEIRDCPIEVLAVLAERAEVDVTVENARLTRSSDQWISSVTALYPGETPGEYQIRDCQFDVHLTNAQFRARMKIWDQNGVYAVFTRRSPLPLKASDLEDAQRYAALKNFGFVLEFALSPIDGWSSVASPDSTLIDLAEEILKRGSP